MPFPAPVKSAMQAKYTAHGTDIANFKAAGNNTVAAAAAANRLDLQVACNTAGDTPLT